MKDVLLTKISPISMCIPRGHSEQNGGLPVAMTGARSIKMPAELFAEK
jgi:hypothetical protein